LSPDAATPHAGTFFVRLEDLLPDVRAAIECARTSDGWDLQTLRRAINHEFDFLGAFTDVRIDGRPPVEAVPSAQLIDERAEWLVLGFTPPAGRDLATAERTFQQSTRRAERGDAKGAMPQLRRISAEFPEVAKFHRALGQAHLVLGELDDAEDEFLRSRIWTPSIVTPLTLLGNLYSRRDRPAEAIPLYERSLELGRNVYALNNLGAALAQTGQKVRAIECLRCRHRRRSSIPECMVWLALTLIERTRSVSHSRGDSMPRRGAARHG